MDLPMRNRLIMVCLAWAAFGRPAQAQFICTVTSENLPKNLNHGSALLCSGNSCIAAGGYHDYLIFLRSSDGGHSWYIEDPGKPIDTMEGITGIDMIDSMNMVAYGISGHSPYGLILRTSDGGQNWEQESVPTREGQITGLSFCNPLEGIVTSGGIGAFLTTDGGRSWDTVAAFHENQFLGWDCHDYGNGRYRISEQVTGRIYYTSNRWMTIDTLGPIISDPSRQTDYQFYCDFGSGDTVLGYGYHGPFPINDPCIARTTDGGQHWKMVFDDTTNLTGGISDFSNINADTIVAGGPENVALWSTDHGATWEADTLICSDTNFDGYQNDGIGLNSEGELVGAFHSFAVAGQKIKSSIVIGHRVTSTVVPIVDEARDVRIFPNPATAAINIAGLTPGHRDRKSVV